jgi:RNA polymerase-binding transcription factor DksA
MNTQDEATWHQPQEAVPIEVAAPAGIGGLVLTAAQKVSLRVLLEARWREQVADLTELSIRVHDLPDDVDRRTQRRLLLELAGAHQRLRDLEDGMARLADDRFGWCEACGRLMPYEHLEAEPAARHCAHCRTT